MMKIDQFVEKYTEYASAYPDYMINKSISNKAKINKLIKLNQKLLKNDDFSHNVIDLLFESKDIGVLGIISLVALSIDYRKSDAIETIEKIIEENRIPYYAYYLEFSLREKNIGDEK